MRNNRCRQFFRLSAAVFIYVVCAGLLVSVPANAESAKDSEAAPKVTEIDPPSRILFVGNSFTYYNDSLHSHLRNLMRAGGMPAKSSGGKKVRVRALTLSGGWLYEHQGGLVQTVGEDDYDLVIMHGHSTTFLERKTARRFAKTAKQASKFIRKKGAEPAFLMTWAYKGRPQMLGKIAGGYTKVGNELDALVIPVGQAFALAQEEHPEIDLYSPDIDAFVKNPDGTTGITYKKDIKHPSLAGTYLAACATYAALFGRSPVALPYTASLPPAHAAALQRIAWQTVQEYYGW